MLVLSRKQGESVLVDSTIQVKIVSKSKGRVKLEISALDHMRIIRSELISCRPNAAVTQEETWPHPAKV